MSQTSDCLEAVWDKGFNVSCSHLKQKTDIDSFFSL